ncbi:UPF0481 protein At3g47200-like [Prosopis cineraria]|uniref:UPF0481 protein At3g47200-like n=1 Tax=Prosopis cineraria TaxID=364024 RepID=UPI00241011B6|nr:UPF0481 protein At3g47200-like [Prosopis cineraria]
MGEAANTTEGFNNHITIDVKSLSNSLVQSLGDKLENLSPLSIKCSICRLPVQLRERNEKSFTPREISIGPLHHNNENLKHMELHKLRLLKDFLSRSKASLFDCVQLLKKKELQLRNCYADPIEFDSDKFIEIILVDAAFILELLFRNNISDLQDQCYYDHFFCGPWKLRFIKTDMLLLENQVPFFVIEDLLSLVRLRSDIPIKDDVRRSAIKLTYEFFKRKLNLSDMEDFDIEEKVGEREIQHFVDFARICYVPQELPGKNKLKCTSMPSATKLHEAGVKFKVKKSGNPFDIKFKDGVMEISPLRIKDATEIILRNIIAYERCHLHDNYVNDYVFILDRLVDTARDVEILIYCGIIESKLSGTQEVASTINKLSPGITMARRRFYFTDLCEKVNDYYKVPWHKWRVTLKEDYFSNPWAIISVVAAISLLVLTVVQTSYAVISYYY